MALNVSPHYPPRLKEKKKNERGMEAYDGQPSSIILQKDLRKF